MKYFDDISHGEYAMGGHPEARLHWPFHIMPPTDHWSQVAPSLYSLSDVALLQILDGHQFHYHCH
jgi:hypothetical protein